MSSLISRERLMVLVPTTPLTIAAALGTPLLAAFASWCYADYKSYLALGPGGPPYNLIGWAFITFAIRPFALSKPAALHVSDYPATGAHPTIDNLPRRHGPRASLGGIAPHRQLSQHAPKSLRTSIDNLFHNAAAQHPDLLEIKKSLYERLHDALFVAPNALRRLPEVSVARTSRGEIGHSHTDLSVHLYLSPADARQVIEKGWGERHRMSVPRGRLLSYRFGIADTYLMLYGPRDEGEMDVLRVILENSIRFMTGRDDVQRLEWQERL